MNNGIGSPGRFGLNHASPERENVHPGLSPNRFGQLGQPSALSPNRFGAQPTSALSPGRFGQINAPGLNE